MRPALVVVPLLVTTLSAGCSSTKFGREFASPDPRAITVGKTGKAELQRLFAFTSNLPDDMTRLK